MAITNKDIVLYQSQDNTDNDSGGGSRTSNPVVDGAVNNLFPDISRIDTTSGDVALRKVFPVINTDNRDIYYGAHAMLRQVPSDPNVSALIFFTDNPHDIRSEAQDKIEAYVVPSFKSSFYLYGNHIEGSKAVTWLQLQEESIPDVGETYLLKYNAIEQYVRVDRIETQVVTLTFQQSTYKRRRIIATITQPLEYAFPGSDFNPTGQENNTTDTFNTQIADAAKFYGTKNLKLDATEGQTVITVDSIYEQLVPSTVKQTPLINNDALNQGEVLLNDPNSEVSELSGSLSGVQTGETIQTLFPILPLSLRFSSANDDGNGNIVNNSGQTIGTVNYKVGSFVLTTNPGGTYYYKPASVYDAAVKNSAMIEITQENQGSVYVMNLNPMPSVPNLYVDYRTGGKWYRIPCNNDGTLGNDAAIGAGNLSDNGDGTGTVSVTLGSNPDLESQIIFSWSDQESVKDVAKLADVDIKPQIVYKLQHTNVIPESFSLTWDNGSKTITSDSSGVINYYDANLPSGSLTGTINYNSGVLTIDGIGSTSSRLPAVDALVDISYDYYGQIPGNEEGGFVIETNPNFIAGTDAGTGRKQYTYSVGTITGDQMVIKVTGFRTTSSFNTATVLPETIYLRTYSGNGKLKAYYDEAGTKPITITYGQYATASIIEGEFDGSGNIVLTVMKHRKINYTDGYKTMTGSTIGGGSHTYQVPNSVAVYEDTDVDTFTVESFEEIQYQTDAINPSRPSNNYAANEVYSDTAEIKISFPANIVGDVEFYIYQQTSSYRYYSLNTEIFNYQNIQVGEINKLTGECTINYNQPITLDFTATKLFTDDTVKNNMSKLIVFKTASDDLVTSSLQLRYTTINGSYNATSDANGVVTGTDIDSSLSKVDTQTGAAIIFFNAPVDPTSIKYDAVAQTTLPLNPELLGLNPVRLPPNGRVPVFRAGYHLVIFNEQETPITGTPVAGQTEALSRNKQAYVEIIDVNGARLDFAQYSADRENGTVTFADPLDLVDRNGSPMTAPFTIVDRVEDMVLCTSAEINGVVSISAPLTRDYLSGTTRVASALVWGDIGARYYNLFSQQSFDGWYDEITTNPTTAQYDDVNYPIQINNQDSVAGRWMLRFISSTTVEVVEEQLGVVIASVSIATTNVAPLNPATGQPYFIMDFNGFGAGWVTGNVIRFNTDSGDENMWLIRTVKSGQLTVEVDAMDVEIRGDAN